MVIRLDENYNAMTSTALLGYVGETNARPVSVEGLTVDGADRYVLTIDYGDGTVYEVDITGGQWTPTADILRSAQTVSCQICAKKLSGDEYILLKKSRIFRLRIGAAIGDTAIPSPSVAADALDRISAIGEQVEADVERAENAASTAMQAAENAKKSATAAGLSADTATQAASRAETAKTAAETSAAQSETARQGAENARAEAVKSQNSAKVSAAQASVSAQQTEADKNITAGYAQTAKTNADNTATDRQAVQTLATQVTTDKATVADHAAQVATDRKAAETAAQTAQAVADSLPEDYVTAVAKIAENTAEISAVKLTDKELQRRVNALYDMGNGITHQFETDSGTAYAKTIPTGSKLMSVKNVGGRSIVWNQLVKTNTDFSNTITDTRTFFMLKLMTFDSNGTVKEQKILIWDSNEIKSVKNSFIFKITADGNTVSIRHNGEKQDIRIYENATTQTIANHTYYLSINIKSADPSTVGGLQCNNLMLIDLTQMFGSGNEPSTVEEFEKIFPNDYYPYNAGEIVSTGMTEVEYGLFGRNLYNYSELKKNGYVKLHVVGGRQLYRSNTLGRTVEWTLFSKTGTKIGTFEDLNFKSGIGFNLPNNADYIISTDTYAANAKTYIGYSPDTTYVPYDDGFIAYQIPEAIRNLPGYGWSAGTARNYVDYENKRYVQCVNSVDLGTLTWTAGGGISSQTVFIASSRKICGQKLSYNSAIASNILCSKYLAKSQNEVWSDAAPVGIATNATIDGYVYVNDTAYTDATAFKQAMQGVMLYYELETPIVTDISDLIDDDFLRNIEVEAGGSVTFKNSNGDDYRIPVPSEEEYIVKLSEIGGSV